MGKNLTLLVNSCDKFSDAWDPFFRLLKANWSEMDYEIVLNSETKRFDCDYLKVRTVTSTKNTKWSARVIKALKTIKTEFVLFFLEDFFIQEKVDNETFLKALDLMEKDKSIGFIGLKYANIRKYKDGRLVTDKEFVSKDELVPSYNRVNSLTALWRTDYLLKLLRKDESVWAFEHQATLRSYNEPEKVLIINHTNNICKPVFVFDVDADLGYGIAGGKWLKNNIELFDKFGIKDVNFDNLGFADDDFVNDYLIGKVSRKVKKESEPPQNAIIEFAYRIKKLLKTD